MKVILLQDIKSLGRKGDIKEVSEGYARNFLLPKKIAEIATAEAVENINIQKEKEREENTKNLEKMRQLAAILKDKKVVIKSKEKGGKLFGSISKMDIAKKLSAEGMEIDSDKILTSPIKKIGEYKIEIRLAADISTRINLKIEGE